jgi:thiamine kinase-like enzyme
MINDSEYIRNLLGKLLKLKKIELLRLEDKGRFYFGFAKNSEKDFIVKVSKSKKESLYLQNSTHFNKQLKKLNPPFEVASLEFDGFILDDFYFKVEEKIQGKPFAELKESISVIDIDKPEKYFNKVAEAILWLQKQNIVLPRDIEKFKDIKVEDKINNERIIKTMIGWSYNSTPKLSDLLKIVSKNKLMFKKVTAHKDMTPINLIVTSKDKIGLVDMDIAKTAPKYYDMVEFYNRLWTRVCKPQLARKFLGIVLNKIKDNKKIFFNQFLVISAFKGVGNYWEVMHLKENQKKRLKFAESYIDHIVNREFLLNYNSK